MAALARQDLPEAFRAEHAEILDLLTRLIIEEDDYVDRLMRLTNVRFSP